MDRKAYQKALQERKAKRKSSYITKNDALETLQITGLQKSLEYHNAFFASFKTQEGDSVNFRPFAASRYRSISMLPHVILNAHHPHRATITLETPINHLQSAHTFALCMLRNHAMQHDHDDDAASKLSLPPELWKTVMQYTTDLLQPFRTLDRLVLNALPKFRNQFSEIQSVEYTRLLTFDHPNKKKAKFELTHNNMYSSIYIQQEIPNEFKGGSVEDIKEGMAMDFVASPCIVVKKLGNKLTCSIRLTARQTYCMTQDFEP